MLALPVGFDTGLGQIKDWIEEGRECVPAEVRGQVHMMDIKADYLAFLLKYKGDWSDLKIAMDVSNGMASLFVRDIFGDQPSYIYEELDGRFPNHEPNPLNLKNIVDLQKLVSETRSDIGVIFDGDADRCLAVDENGNIVDGDAIMYILGKRLKSRGMLNSDTVVATVMSNSGFVKSLKEIGIESAITTVGDRYVYECMQQNDYCLGGEQSGHIIFRDFATTGDGQLTAVQLLSYLKRCGRPLHELKKVMKRYPQHSANVGIGEEGKRAFYTNSAVKAAV